MQKTADIKAEKDRLPYSPYIIWNIGVYSRRLFSLSGLPPNYWGIDGFEHYGNLNLLKGGIQHAHKITTVSPTYSSEIKTKIFGHGLEESLKFRAGDLIVILNGIDEEKLESDEGFSNSWYYQSAQAFRWKVKM